MLGTATTPSRRSVRSTRRVPRFRAAPPPHLPPRTVRHCRRRTSRESRTSRCARARARTVGLDGQHLFGGCRATRAIRRFLPAPVRGGGSRGPHGSPPLTISVCECAYTGSTSPTGCLVGRRPPTGDWPGYGGPGQPDPRPRPGGRTRCHERSHDPQRPAAPLCVQREGHARWLRMAGQHQLPDHHPTVNNVDNWAPSRPVTGQFCRTAVTTSRVARQRHPAGRVRLHRQEHQWYPERRHLGQGYTVQASVAPVLLPHRRVGQVLPQRQQGRW